MSCGKCEMLGAMAPCDECFYGNRVGRPLAPSPPAAPELPDRAARLAAVPLEHRAFCVYCGLGVGVDEDGCCTGCGNGVESLDTVRALLATQGLSIIRTSELGEAELARRKP